MPTPARGRYFYQRRDGRQNQPVLYVRDGLDGEDRVAIDPNALDPAGTTALDWYYPSDDGRLLAYGLSQNGSEQSVLHVFDVDAGTSLPERIPRTRAADLAWLPDASGFYYTRYPEPGAVPAGEEHYHRAVFFHPLGGDPADDALVYQPGAKEYWPGVALSPDGRWLLISVARTFDQTDLYLGDRNAAGWTPSHRSLPSPRACRSRSTGRWRTDGCSSAPTSTRRRTGCTRWIPSIPSGATGASWCRRGRRRCSKGLGSWATGWR